jgi:glutaredoxin-like YruB-family protein
MNTVEVSSHKELKANLGREKRSFLLIYKKGSEQSDRAFENLVKAAAGVNSIGLFTVDVNHVKDIHPAYSVTSAPTLVEFAGLELRNSYKGAHETSYYKGLFDNAVYVARAEKEGRKIKQVTVYTTPTCSWCNTLKSYLNKNNIRYTEVDVSRNETAAQEMVRRSGQQGVPQTLIGGEMIVGFDRNRINRLLEIQG